MTKFADSVIYITIASWHRVSTCIHLRKLLGMALAVDGRDLVLDH